MALGLVGLLLSAAIAFAHEHVLFNIAVAFALVWGPIFLTIAWATRRALRNRPVGSAENQQR
jgi:hypothetical protein